MNHSSSRHANRRRASFENSLSSVLLRVALLAGGAGALLAPQAAAQAVCTTSADGNTETCSGAAVNGGVSRNWVDDPNTPGPDRHPTTFNVQNVTGPILPVNVLGIRGSAIRVARDDGALTDLSVNLDASVNLTAEFSIPGVTVPISGVIASDIARANGSALAGPAVRLNSAATVNYNSLFTSPIREVTEGVQGEIAKKQADIATVNTALAIPDLDARIKAGYGSLNPWLFQLGASGGLLVGLPDLFDATDQLIAKANCVMAPGLEGPLSWFQNLCWFVPPPDKPEVFRLQAQQFKDIATDRINYLSIAPRPDEAPFLWRGALEANARGVGVISGDVFVTNNGQLSTRGDFAAGIIATSKTEGEIHDGGNVAVLNNGRITTANASSAGIIALSQGAETFGFNSPGHAGDVRVAGNGAIDTLGSGSFGILAMSVGGASQVDAGDQPAGNGGIVKVEYNGAINTRQIEASGIEAISKGGRGGNGNNAGFDESQAGGIGGFGGAVTVNLLQSGSVHTVGDKANAIAATSVGGEGGKGGSDSEVRDASRGGSGGNGGRVAVSNKGDLLTEGKEASGVFASSIAGAGGLGGSGHSVFRGRGGDGGEAGRAEEVDVVNDGKITTKGKGSFGIFAQSAGGVAGNGGGSTGAFSSNAGDGGSTQTARCLGILKICAQGGTVNVDNNATGIVHTDGDYSHAIFAQSLGGGGGVAGDASGWFSVSGGDGGNGALGGEVNIHNFGRLETTGARSGGVFAQSIGGGGGSGGDATGGGQNFSLQIGGDGGAGGKGGDVTITNVLGGLIQTSGERSDGIFAQSIGGGGGAGGDANATVIGGFALPIAIGGSGGGGGDAGDRLKIENYGRIDAAGDFSNGIFAQSIGGGGGVGGTAKTFGGSLLDFVSIATAVSIGGDGGAGGSGKEVVIDNYASGSIITRDFDAMGIIAQSIGGGGGAGGSSVARALAINPDKGVAVAVAVAIGGDGGDGGAGGHIDIENLGSVITFGDLSTAIFGQSIGGGGGIGGDASAATETIAGGNASEVKVDVSIGGSGGKGGDGDVADVINRGMVVSLGDYSNGIMAQSVGGGGGMGGAGKQGDLFEDLGIPEMPSLDDDIEDKDSTKSDRDRARTRYKDLQKQAKAGNPRTADSIGRTSKSGKKGGKSGSVEAHVAIGGSGGAGGKGLAAHVQNFGEVITGGYMSAGVVAQSIGGGGGMGGGGEANAEGDLSLGASNGGEGAPAGNGGDAIILNQGDVTTLGHYAYGIMGQSVGGGGGAGGIGSGKSGDSANILLKIGGDGGNGGVGGHVDIDQFGNVMTLGAGAIGVFGQSIGGGGGMGAATDQDSLLSINIGGNGGDADKKDGQDVREIQDHGGQVDVDIIGRVTTEGDSAHGVFAQSVGGGGGLAGGIVTGTYVFTTDSFGGLSIDTGLTVGVGSYGSAGSTGVGGDGGKVTTTTTGLITTLGKSAHGIVAQSVGGGGGMGSTKGIGRTGDQPGDSDPSLPKFTGYAGSTGDPGAGGLVTVTHSGSIHAFGEDSVGIWAQSMGGGANGLGKDVKINLLGGGEVIGGSGNAGAGIFISGGFNNTITNLGGRISALSGMAIVATDGNDTINNSGLISGSVGLGGGANAIINQAGGRFETGAAVYIGTIGANLLNSGIVAPFGDTAAGTTTLAGNYLQTASGDLKVNLNFGAPSDRITVQGIASLAGKVTPITGHVSTLQPGVWTTVLSASAITGASGISIDHMDTLVVDWGTRTQGANFQIGINKIEFNIPGLERGQSELAAHVQDIWKAGAPSELNAVLDQLAYGKDASAYKQLLDNIHPHTAFSQGNHTALAGQAALGALMSCPEGAGWASPLHETSCTWIRQSYSDSSQGAGVGDPGYTDHVARMQAGQQFDMGDGWFAGYSVGYDTGSFAIGNDTKGVNDSGHFGGAVKYETGPWLLSGAADYSLGQAERRRRTGFPVEMIAESTSHTHLGAVRARAAYLRQWGEWYLRPAVDVDVYYMKTPSFNETGAGAFNMVMESNSKGFGAATLSVTGGVTTRGFGALWHPYVELNATDMSEDSIELDGRLQGAAPGVSDFVVSSALPDHVYGGRLGLEAFYPLGSIRLEYEQREGGDGYEVHSGSFKLRFGF